MNTVLLLIDVQQSFVHRPYYSTDGLEAYLGHQNRLVEHAQRAGVPVVRVLHEEPGGPGQPFSAASGLVRPMEGLRPVEAALTVRKTRHSALVGTGLDVWLVAQGVRRVVVSGIRTEQCCETTARHASDLGWQVVFVPEATMTWDIALPDGSVYPSAEIRRRTQAVLHGRFARISTVEEALHDGRDD
jgi:nicotinamidase-related amidase